jgi:hypothetical protein
MVCESRIPAASILGTGGGVARDLAKSQTGFAKYLVIELERSNSMTQHDIQINFVNPEGREIGLGIQRVWEVLSVSDQERVLVVLKRGLVKLFKRQQGLSTVQERQS